MHGVHLVRPGDRIDVIASLPDPKIQQTVAVVVAENTLVSGVTKSRGPGQGIDQVDLLVGDAQAEELFFGATHGGLHALLRHPDDRGVPNDPARATVEMLATEARARPLHEQRRSMGLLVEKEGGGAGQAEARSPRAELPPSGMRAVSLSVAGACIARPGDRADVLASFDDPASEKSIATTVLFDVTVLDSRPAPGQAAGCRTTLGVLLPEATLLLLGARVGVLGLAVRHPQDRAPVDPRARTTLETLLTGERRRSLEALHQVPIQTAESDACRLARLLEAGWQRCAQIERKRNPDHASRFWGALTVHPSGKVVLDQVRRWGFTHRPPPPGEEHHKCLVETAAGLASAFGPRSWPAPRRMECDQRQVPDGFHGKYLTKPPEIPHGACVRGKTACWLAEP